MKAFYYDLHIHTCLSPCGDDDMTPANIVGMSALKGLDVIAITDHNTCKNCAAAMALGKEYGITVIPGMELTTQEEVHVVCLFPSLEQAMAFDNYVEKHLLPIPNRPETFGRQQIMNETDEIIGEYPTLLISATDISFDDVYNLLESYSGIMIPAHIDKSSFSLLSNLGFVPPDSLFQTFELKNLKNLHRITKDNPTLSDKKVISSSDAHYLEYISEPVNSIYALSSNIKDILSALK